MNEKNQANYDEVKTQLCGVCFVVVVVNVVVVVLIVVAVHKWLVVVSLVLVFVTLLDGITFQSCQTGVIYLSWVHPSRATKPRKPLETAGTGMTQRIVGQHS